MSANRIRPIDPTSDTEVERVARYMRATLVEVEGEVTGTALYSMEWLRNRVLWHLDPTLATAAVLLAEDASGNVVGHTIVRRQNALDGGSFGLVATTFVEPFARRQGIADRLLLAGERWFVGQGLQKFSTWTSAINTSLIRLYEKHGYQLVETHTHEVTGTMMVRLFKTAS